MTRTRKIVDTATKALAMQHLRPSETRIAVSEETMDALERGIEDARARDARDLALSVLERTKEARMKR